jgi:hypothetical protein
MPEDLRAIAMRHGGEWRLRVHGTSRAKAASVAGAFLEVPPVTLLRRTPSTPDSWSVAEGTKGEIDHLHFLLLAEGIPSSVESIPQERSR